MFWRAAENALALKAETESLQAELARYKAAVEADREALHTTSVGLVPLIQHVIGSCDETGEFRCFPCEAVYAIADRIKAIDGLVATDSDQVREKE